MSASRALILLCAGRGSRMQPLSTDLPKCMLQVGDRRVIDHLLEAALPRIDGEIVAVTGFGADAVRQHLAMRYGTRVATAENPRYRDDVNILSVQTGVDALRHPERGYVVVETDLLLVSQAWERIFEAMASPHSFWVCKDRYHPGLTGGIVHADAQGRIDAIEYRPQYEAAYAGWPKMVGVLGVAPDQVDQDRRCRQAAIADTIAQYYLMPWKHDLPDLPCRVVDLGDAFARSFNTAEEFEQASRQYLALTTPSPLPEHS